VDLKPSEPWVPHKFSVWVTKKQTVSPTKDRNGKTVRRSVDCWDVGGRVDGIQYLKRFAKASEANQWKSWLERDYALGLPFDVKLKRFVRPEREEGPRAPTVYELTEQFYRIHPEWEPKTKILAASSFGRARRWLLIPGPDPTAQDLEAIQDFLDHASFMPDHLSGQLTQRQATGRDWLVGRSAPADSLTTADVETFVARFEFSQRDRSKRVSAATLIRFLQPLKACWGWAVARDDVAIERNPWASIRPRRKVKGKSSVSATRAGLVVDADLVIGVPEALALAAACAEHGEWGGVVECFVLVMAFCGLRPGEAAGLLWEDLDLPADRDAGWVTVRRTHRPVAARWLDSGEDPVWGPLKDRDLADTRRAPVHPLLVEKLERHLAEYGKGPDGLVFHRKGKPFDPDMFNRSVWHKGRAALWPLRNDLPSADPRQPKLARLRRHDLRHAACSWWLREGVDAVVCQRWSGHKTLSVFLDIYQGVAPGREDEGVRRLAASFSPADDEKG
jgi:integrase